MTRKKWLDQEEFSKNILLLAEEQTNKSLEHNREGPETDSHKYSQLIFNKEAKVIQQRKDSLFNKWY